MAVAEKPTRTTTPRSPEQLRVFGSLLGAVYILVTLGMIFSGLPVLWGNLVHLNPFLSVTLLLLVTAVVGVGLVHLGFKLEGTKPVPGVRAGAFVGALLLFGVVLATLGLANLMSTRELGMGIELGVTAILAGGLLLAVFWIFTRPGFGRFLVGFEEQGWFHATSFKATQGVRVRRCTLIALLVVGASGIWTAMQHQLFRPGHWEIPLPYVPDLYLFLMFHVDWTLPVVLLGLTLWVSWRVTNLPSFADFLIATEAEMNKVSWTTRKRLFQDTVVVLVTVLLLTVFLFLVDILWIRILGSPWIRVLQINLYEARQKQHAPTEW